MRAPETLVRIRIAAALICLWLTSSTVVSRAQQAPPPDALSAVVNAPHVPQHRPVPHRRVGHVDRGARDRRRTITSTRSTRRRAAAGSGRRRTPARRGRRSPTASAPRPSAPSRSRRRIRASSGWARAIRRTRGRRTPGKGVFKSTDAGATWQFMGLPDSHHIARHRHPSRPIPTSSTSRRWAICSRERRARRVPHDRRRRDVEESAVRQRRRRRDRPRDQPQDAGHALRGDVRQGPPARGRSSRAVPRAASTGPTTAATSGSGSAAACRPARSAASASTSIRRIR